MRDDGRYDGPWGLPDYDVADDHDTCGTCGGSGNAPCLACGDTRINVDERRRCSECDPPLPCPDCEGQGRRVPYTPDWLAPMR